MKNLVEYIKETQSSVFSEVNENTLSLIDYLYNEGVVIYDDRHLVKYSDGELDIPFEDITKTLLDEYSDKLSSRTKSELSKYLKEGKTTKESDIENAIIDAIKSFVEKGNCRKFI